MLAESLAAFRRDLPELLKTQRGKWVAHRGPQQIGIARTAATLHQQFPPPINRRMPASCPHLGFKCEERLDDEAGHDDQQNGQTAPAPDLATQFLSRITALAENTPSPKNTGKRSASCS